MQKLKHHQQIGERVTGKLEAGDALQFREQAVVGELRILARLAQFSENLGVALANGDALFAAQQAVEDEL